MKHAEEDDESSTCLVVSQREASFRSPTELFLARYTWGFWQEPSGATYIRGSEFAADTSS
jgi:hypothetical protein